VQRLLLFGANGAIGSATRDAFRHNSWQVVASGRHSSPLGPDDPDWIALDPFADTFDPSALRAKGPFTAVCWAQGANTNDNIYDVDKGRHMELYQANCLFIIVTLQSLLKHGLLAPGSRLCVVSSIWQNLGRQNKLSYCVTKAALQGLVLSASADLAAEGHLFNAVLPGAIDTPMTRRNLTPEQIESVVTSTKFGRLLSLDDVVQTIQFLCSPRNTGLTGQFITADLGFSHVRIF
jgi:3-oxoacyl-[acyl-carrier protein] reductase